MQTKTIFVKGNFVVHYLVTSLLYFKGYLINNWTTSSSSLIVLVWTNYLNMLKFIVTYKKINPHLCSPQTTPAIWL